ncbi:hypothetical protein CsatB_001176 [Cannabis sativa]
MMLRLMKIWFFCHQIPKLLAEPLQDPENQYCENLKPCSQGLELVGEQLLLLRLGVLWFDFRIGVQFCS